MLRFFASKSSPTSPSGGETPYVKLISQLFGDRQMIARSAKGRLPKQERYWLFFHLLCLYPLDSLHEEREGSGPMLQPLGMALGNKKMKERVAKLLTEMIESDKTSDEYKALAQEWIANKEDADKTKEIAPKLRACIAESAAKGCPVCKELQTLNHYLVKRSQ